jgi:hypothetical protein
MIFLVGKFEDGLRELKEALRSKKNLISAVTGSCQKGAVTMIDRRFATRTRGTRRNFAAVNCAVCFEMAVASSASRTMLC